jgi:toxin CcdB
LDRLTRFDVAEANGTLYVVIETDLLPSDTAVLVIPLLPDYSTVRDLNPVIVLDGRQLVLATRPIVGVRRSALRRTGTVADQSDRITRAVDVLMAGV